TLPSGLKSGVQEAFQDGKPDIVSCYIEPGCSLRTVTLEFMMACDVLWHKSAIAFGSQGINRVEVSFDVSWDLTGLPGAMLECAGDASDSRFSSLDGSRQQWSEKLTLFQQGVAGIVLGLDEKKAASICLYSKSPGEQYGCGAVVVVAPVRPQLLRKPVRVAVVVEVRNPQDSLATRDLVDHLSSALNPTDQVSIFLMGSSVTRKLLDWKQAADVQEDDLAQLLDPSMMGRAQYFWEGFQRVLEDCQDATHVILSTPGPADPSPDDLVSRLPVFTFAVGRKPNISPLEELATRTGGFLSEQNVDGIDSFLQRMIIRLSPPLLRDFRLEGWGLEKLYPPGVTQVYTDKPTLLLGLYDGLLPQTVTLGGLSPAGQKLAQRVRVEDFPGFSLMPLFEDSSGQRTGESGSSSIKAQWKTEKFTLFEACRPVELEEAFEVEESEQDMADDLMGPPAIDMVGPGMDAVEFAPSAGDTLTGDLFSPSDGSTTIGDDLFGEAEADTGFVDGSDTLFGEEPLFKENMDLGGSGFFDETPSSAESTPKEGSGEQTDAVSSDTLGWDIAKTAAMGSGETEPEPADSPDWGGSDLSFGSDDTIGDDLFAQTSGDAAGDDLFEQPEPFSSGEESREPSQDAPASAETTITQAPRTEAADAVGERSTVSVDFQIPEWIKKLSGLDNKDMKAWLYSCPIDELALALVDADRSLADTFLSKLEGPRKTAIELQMELGRLLSADERREAGELLDRRLG
ncbi:MAG: hypothetical protein KC800_12545, partial [Candidatus Eremiobacteraeota bacterium]|nr:hypothetical protein [Candidatus Eremiobacteraeota bacterium]